MIHEWRSTGPVGATHLADHLTALEKEGWNIFQIDHVGMAKVEAKVISPDQKSGVMPIYNVISQKIFIGEVT